MIVLSIDTALSACSAAILDMRSGSDRMIERMEPMARGHAEALMPLLEGLLDEAALGVDEIDRFAVTVGPGTFTGVRVGVAAARGFALATGRPAVGVTTLEALAETARMAGDTDRPLLVAVDARRCEVYAQCFDRSGTIAEPVVAPVSEVVARLQPEIGAVFGSGAASCAEEATRQGRRLEILGQDAAPRPAAVARLALHRAAARPPAPLYLRRPDARPQPGGISRQ